jgi:microsomal epoxide hydrolase
MMPGFPAPVIGPDVQPPSDAERAHAEIQARWEREEGGYNLIQETRPQTLAYGLHDSPAGLAAWILEKWRAWTDPAGDVERYFSRSPPRQRHPLLGDGDRERGQPLVLRARPEPRRITSRITVPTGVALSTEAVQRVPRERAERSYADIRRWTEFPRGGHFLAAEEPRLLAEELRAFFRPLRQTA